MLLNTMVTHVSFTSLGYNKPIFLIGVSDVHFDRHSCLFSPEKGPKINPQGLKNNGLPTYHRYEWKAMVHGQKAAL